MVFAFAVFTRASWIDLVMVGLLGRVLVCLSALCWPLEISWIRARQNLQRPGWLLLCRFQLNLNFSSPLKKPALSLLSMILFLKTERRIKSRDNVRSKKADLNTVFTGSISRRNVVKQFKLVFVICYCRRETWLLRNNTYMCICAWKWTLIK